jgi:hypothetical protein
VIFNSSTIQSYVTINDQSDSHLGVKHRSGAQYCILLLSVVSFLVSGALSDERTGLPFTAAAGSRQRSHSQVGVPRDSWPYFTVSDSRLPQHGGPDPRIYIPQ